MAKDKKKENTNAKGVIQRKTLCEKKANPNPL
jgi:hypothetical protein